MMYSRGIRGAITVDNDDSDCIKSATIELLSKIIDTNLIQTEDISHVIFTMTKDLTAAFPAKFAREITGWDQVPMMCFNELDIDDSLKKCLRILVVVNTEKKQNEISHVYLKGAIKLRPDIA